MMSLRSSDQFPEFADKRASAVANQQNTAKQLEGARSEWKPMDLRVAKEGCGHNRLSARERSQAGLSMITTVAACVVAPKGGVGVSDIANDIVDSAAAGLELQSNPLSLRCIPNEDACAKRKGSGIRKLDGMTFIAEGCNDDHWAERFFDKQVRIVRNVCKHQRRQLIRVLRQGRMQLRSTCDGIIHLLHQSFPHGSQSNRAYIGIKIDTD